MSSPYKHSKSCVLEPFSRRAAPATSRCLWQLQGTGFQTSWSGVRPSHHTTPHHTTPHHTTPHHTADHILLRGPEKRHTSPGGCSEPLAVQWPLGLYFSSTPSQRRISRMSRKQVRNQLGKCSFFLPCRIRIHGFSASLRKIRTARSVCCCC